MQPKTAKSSFTRELDDFMYRLEDFSDMASEARATVKATRHAAASKSGMPVMSPSRNSPVPVLESAVTVCPGCIQSLSRVQALWNDLTAGKNPLVRACVVWNLALRHNAPERVLVRRKCDSRIFEATLPALLNQSPSDVSSQLEGSVPFASISRRGAAFSVVTGHETVTAWEARLRALTHAELVEALDGWLTFALTQIVGPANGQRALYVRSLINLKYEWDELPIRLTQQQERAGLFSAPH
ncbi:hypothetical protein [Paraburkholderia youngii]|uniref:Uncharacterized protein n=1 Tax=Paraburkholderia youngii TaxID=2782701 RepID=A0A7W8L5Z8_9BURK|nr:hypothetical protein [Paraburkholderia youngii]MBB5400533.1 hypothetical protein [Paraburkholderia youngii]